MCNQEKTTSEKGISLIKKYEGLKLSAYRDPAGVLTIGYGHTKTVKAGMSINETMADLLLVQDISEAEAVIKDMVKVILTQGQFDALVSFVFNVGGKKIKSSTLLRLINQNSFLEAGEEFMRWTKARTPGGMKELPGLVKRRAEEKALFLAMDRAGLR